VRLREFFDKAIEAGIGNDLRGRELVEKELEARKKQYNKATDEEKEFFDLDSLTNPYSDSRIHVGTGDEEIRTALVGIDIEPGEIAVAHALINSGKKIDLLIAHHPEGTALARLWDVMGMQSDILASMGVPISAAESLMDKRISDVERRLLPTNHARAVDCARLLEIPMLNLHTPGDNMVASYLQRMFDDKKPYLLSDVLDLLMEIPEYRDARMMGAGPKIIIGTGKRKTGKVFVDMTGGTEGSKDIFPSLIQSGVTTVVGMHFSDDHRKEAEKSNLNLVIAGHISSDNLGLNLLFDEIASNIEYLECSGFRRFKR